MGIRPISAYNALAIPPAPAPRSAAEVAQNEPPRRSDEVRISPEAMALLQAEQGAAGCSGGSCSG